MYTIIFMGNNINVTFLLILYYKELVILINLVLCFFEIKFILIPLNESHQ